MLTVVRTRHRKPRSYCVSRRFTHVPRKYPIGISDWARIKQENFFYWDRTKFVKEFYEDTGETVLLLRPRRWAKTTTLSMTKYFFDINNPKLAQELIQGTQLENEKEFVSNTCGQFPVINLSFAACKAADWYEMEPLLRHIISDVYKSHGYLRQRHWWNFWKSNLTPAEQPDFKTIFNGKVLGYTTITTTTTDPATGATTQTKREIANGETIALYQSALKKLTEILYRYHKKRVIVLIDEYDTPVNEAYLNGYHEKALPYLTSVFTGALKDNFCLEKGLLTGILQVAKAGYLSGLNNLHVYSLLNLRYADKYGVKHDELQEALTMEGLNEKEDEVKGYYNGYSTADPSIILYNPWSILNFLADKELKPYWIETGRTDFIANATWSGPLSMQQTIAPLLNGKTVQVPFEVDINYKAMGDERVLWSLLYFSGYITGVKAEGDNLKARIPNSEVRREIAVMWRHVIEEKQLGGYYCELISALLTCNQPVFEEHLCSLALYFSAHDLTKTPESCCHRFMLSALFPLVKFGYRIETNHEAGHGRPDITVHPPVGKPAVIIEFGTHTDPKEEDNVQNNDDLRPAAEKRMQQIKSNKYIQALTGTSAKSVVLCSIVFVQKYVAVLMEEQKL